MSNLARSFKSPPAYLSPRRRPGMPVRSLSSSSEMSTHSAHSGRSDDLQALTSAPRVPDISVTSAPGQATQEHNEAATTSAAEDLEAFPALPRNESPEAPTTCTLSPSRSHRSRPIAIEIPRFTKINTSSSYVKTPPEPLSARGDLPGGYFPFHEDPNSRIRRPHPFHHDANVARQRSITLAAGSVPPMHPERHTPQHPAPPPPAPSSMPVAFAPSFHDHPLPTGKYYPTNYEQRHGQQQAADRPTISASASSSYKSDFPTGPGQTAMPTSNLSPEDEARRRIQQYQRDMVAQASRVLESTAAAGSAQGTMDARYGVLPHKPLSPRLMPLGSPGPVTPMELESTAAGINAASTGYLEQGSAREQRPRSSLATTETSFTVQST